MQRFFLVVIMAIFLLSLMSCASPQQNNIGKVDSDGMLLVPEGLFTMGLRDGELYEQPEHEVYLDSYMIDKHEVSAKDFAAFLNARGNPENRYFTATESSTVAEETVLTAGDTAKQDRLSYVAKQGYENFPANNVSWFGAEEYCRWIGRRLPTEAEWEKAARGDDRRIYPWGDSFPSVIRARYARDFGKTGMDVMVPVDALPAGESFYGAKNMAGNVLEWTHDWFRTNFCDFCDPTGEDYLMAAAEIICGDEASVEIRKNGHEVPPRNNPRGPSVGIFRVLRGGSWQEIKELEIRATHRFWLDPLERFPYTGFRCVAADVKDREEGKDEKSAVEEDLSAFIVCKPKPVAVPVEKSKE